MKRNNLLKLASLAALISNQTLYAETYQFVQNINGLKKQAVAMPTSQDSCKGLLETGQSTGDGLYTITSGGESLNVYCDMSSYGGGWTMIAAQFEQYPVLWDEGLKEGYDPTLASGVGFAFSENEIPAHTQVSIGRNLDPTAIDYFDFTYSTGDIAKQSLVGLKSGIEYHIHRDKASYYNYHDPDDILMSNSDWSNTLTVDRTGGRYNTWAFAPSYPISDYRGYSMLGPRVAYKDLGSWTIWVR